MSLEKLSIETLDGGDLFKTINRQLDEIGRDVINKPGTPDARKLTITVEISPVIVETGSGAENRPAIVCTTKISWPGTKVRGIAKVEGGEVRVNYDFPRSKNPDEQALPGYGKGPIREAREFFEKHPEVKILPPRAAEGE